MDGGSEFWWRMPVLGGLVVVLLAASALVTAGGAGARDAASGPGAAWPKMARDASNTGLSPDPVISSSNAARLGVRWMANTGAAELASPVAQWSPVLQRTLVYVGNEAGDFSAFDAATGAVAWSDNLGSAIRDTAVVASGAVWVSDTYSPSLVKLNAATGAVECSVPLASTELGSATVGTPPGGSETIYMGVNDLGTASGPIYAVDASTCRTDWKFTNYDRVAGTWDPLSFATDKYGRALLLFGTADPDSSVYAVDAVTGAKVWSFKTDSIPGDTNTDVGAGVSVSPPGLNGFRDGVAYVGGKNGYEYALDLTTGAVIWKFNFSVATGGTTPETKSTPAIVGGDIVFGETTGVYDLNAKTGQPIWRWDDGTKGAEVLSAPAVVGPAKQRVVAVTSLTGKIDVLSLDTGSLLYNYQTANFSTSGVADVDGNLLASSADGFLYDLAPGGANGAGPATTVTSPAEGSSVPNPQGDLTIAGRAKGQPVAAVDVAIQTDGASGPWWDSASGTWTGGFYDNPATVASVGSTDTAWSLKIPVPTGGGVYRVFASAAGTDGVADVSAESSQLSPARSSFSVRYSPSAPHLSTTAVYVSPGISLDASGSGFQGGETVGLSIAGQVVAHTVAGSDGGFGPTRMTVPDVTDFGPAALTALGETSGLSTSAAVVVSNEWPEAGGGLLRQGYEPNDPVLAEHVSLLPANFAGQAWSFPSGAPIRASTSIVHDVAYFGNDAGQVYALDVRSSVPIWTYQAGSAVHTTPAIDTGRVIFGTNGQKVIALSTAQGHLLWSASTTSAVESSPAVANGVVYVGSSDGTVYALNEATGAVVWSRTLRAAVSGSPAVDPATGLVVVGDSAGTITALSASTGTVAWTYSTGGAVDATPLIDAGAVYVGSADSQVYALSERTGSLQWKQATDGPITAGAALYYTQQTPIASLVIGSENGTVYTLDLGTGQVKKTYNAGSPVVGVTDTASFIVVATAGGTVDGLKPGNLGWRYKSPSGLASAPTVLNGIIYVTGEDHTLRAFTVPGRPIP
jgi:outer membrane protein assembly factor BamB